MTEEKTTEDHGKLSERLRSYRMDGSALEASQLENEVVIANARLDIQRNNFAAAALQGLLAGNWSPTSDEGLVHGYSRAAFQYADAMMEAAKK